MKLRKMVQQPGRAFEQERGPDLPGLGFVVGIAGLQQDGDVGVRGADVPGKGESCFGVLDAVPS